MSGKRGKSGLPKIIDADNNERIYIFHAIVILEGMIANGIITEKAEAKQVVETLKGKIME